MKSQTGSAFVDLLIITLLCISTMSAIDTTVRINSRRAQQQRIKTIRRPVEREIRLPKQ